MQESPTGAAADPDGRVWLSLAGLVVVMALLLFAPAGTLRYWQAWAYLALFAIASALITLRLMRHDRELLRRRMRGGPAAEQDPVQRLIMALVSVGFLALLMVPALDHRYGGARLPLLVVAVGELLVAAGFWSVHRVYRENSYASATIEVVGGQKVISTGPYAIVRHPMYAGASLLLIGTPLALGSCWGLAALALMIPGLVWRLLQEERLLLRQLPGYAEYRRQVPYRLLPYIW